MNYIYTYNIDDDLKKKLSEAVGPERKKPYHELRKKLFQFFSTCMDSRGWTNGYISHITNKHDEKDLNKDVIFTLHSKDKKYQIVFDTYNVYIYYIINTSDTPNRIMLENYLYLDINSISMEKDKLSINTKSLVLDSSGIH